MKNSDVRTAAKKSGVFLWQIAEALGLADSGFSKKLRKELSQGEKEQIFAIITELSKEAS